MEKQLFYGVDNYTVLPSDVDFSKRMTAIALFKLFHDSACKHNESLGIGRTFLNEKNLYWSMSRISLSIARMPLWGEHVTVKTWPKAMDSVNIFRDFVLYTENNLQLPLAKATASYVLLDIAAHRPQNIEPYSSSIPLVISENALDPRPEKIDSLPCAWNYLKGVTRFGDIDIDGVVKNSKYIEWILNSYSWEHHQNYQLERLELNYLANAFPEEGYLVNMASKGKGMFLNNVVREEDQKELVRAKTQWGTR